MLSEFHAFPNAYLEVDEPPRRSLYITVASYVFLIFGIGSVIADPVLLAYVAYYRTAPVLPIIGEVLDGTSPIGMAGGLDAVLVLGIGLVVVCILDIVAGIWLRRSLGRGGVLGIALQPANVIYAYGFGIPGLYFLAPLWVVLIALGWNSLTHQ